MLCCDARPPTLTMLLMEDLAAYAAAEPFVDVPLPTARSALRNVARLHRDTWHEFAELRPAIERVWGPRGFATHPNNLFGLCGLALKRKMKMPKIVRKLKLVETWTGFGGIGSPKNWMSALMGAEPSPGSVAVLSAWSEAAEVIRSDEVNDALDAVCRHFDELSPKFLRGDNPECVIHGDCHGWNCMFSQSTPLEGEDPEAVLMDWQFHSLGYARCDVMYFLCASVEPDDHGDKDVELLRLRWADRVEKETVEKVYGSIARARKWREFARGASVFVRRSLSRSPRKFRVGAAG
eukprot:gene43036-43234_t